MKKISVISFLVSFPIVVMLDMEKTPVWVNVIIIAWFAASVLAIGHYIKFARVRGNRVV